MYRILSLSFFINLFDFSYKEFKCKGSMSVSSRLKFGIETVNERYLQNGSIN